MRTKINGFVYWAPRILSIIFILFLALFSLDVGAPGLSTLQTIIGLIIHNLPSIILLIILIISWKYEIVGGLAFIIGGLGYMIFVMMHPFDLAELALWLIFVTGPARLIGILFLVGWSQRMKIKKSHVA